MGTSDLVPTIPKHSKTHQSNPHSYRHFGCLCSYVLLINKSATMSVPRSRWILLPYRCRKWNPALEALISPHFVPCQIVRFGEIPLSVFRPDLGQFRKVVSRNSPMVADRFPWGPCFFTVVHVTRPIASASQSRTGIADNDCPRGSHFSIGVSWRGHSCQDLVCGCPWPMEHHMNRKRNKKKRTL